MLKYRLPSGILMGTLIISAVFVKGDIGKYIFLLFGVFLAFAAIYEYLKMLEKAGFSSLPLITACFSSIVLAMIVLGLDVKILLLLFTAVIITSWIRLLPPENRLKSLQQSITSASAVIYILFPVAFLALIYLCTSHSVSGRIYFFFLLIVTKCGDIGAYTVGTISSKVMPGGNHKILPKISPKKSWEGTLGGMLVSICASYIFCKFVPELTIDHGKLFPLIAGILLFWGGFLGDLVESALKRTAGVKDSGNMIPGMGGALDVIDSLLLNAPIFYILIML